MPEKSMFIIASCLAAYLVGSIPTGFIIARMKGVDIRKVGSGNIGATNVFRCVGKFFGIVTFALDMLKGYLPVAVFPLLIQRGTDEVSITNLSLLFGCLAIIGHNWPVWLRFRGGKGVATGAGVLLGVAPLAVLIGVMAWLISFVLTRYVSLASIISAAVIAGSSWWLYRQNLLLAVILSLMCALAVWRHKANIRRLLHGTENRFKK